MGLLSFLFPKPADRIAKAKRLIGEERYAEARAEVMDLDLEEAQQIRSEAEQHLVDINLERALHWARAGNYEQVDSHLDLARKLDQEAQNEKFEAALKVIQSLMEGHRVEAVWQQLTDACLERRKMGGDPGDFTTIAYEGTGSIRLFFFQGRTFGLPGLELEPLSSWFQPAWAGPFVDPRQPDAVELESIRREVEARYPDSVKQELELIVQSVAFMAARKPEEAGLLLMAEEEMGPIAYFELGRAAMAIGEHEAASHAFSQALEQGIDGIVAGFPVQLLPAVNLVWNEQPEAGHALLAPLESTDEHILKLKVATAIEAAALVEARAWLADVAESDESYLQLDGALRLQEALSEQLLLHPILSAESIEDEAAFESAQESVKTVLQAELDAVIAAMRALEPDADEEAAGDGEIDSEPEPNVDETAQSNKGLDEPTSNP